MSRKSKWIEAKSADEFAPAVARRAIAARLKTLWNWLPLAAKHSADDVEYVHQLRVASRRAMAVLEIFDAMLPRKRSKWFAKQLNRVRKAAGEARDLDVLAPRLAAACKAERIGRGNCLDGTDGAGAAGSAAADRGILSQAAETQLFRGVSKN